MTEDERQTLVHMLAAQKEQTAAMLRMLLKEPEEEAAPRVPRTYGAKKPTPPENKGNG